MKALFGPFPPGGGIPVSDKGKVYVSSDDTTLNYLLSKLAAGTGITLTELNPGGNEQLQVSSTGGVGGSGTANYIPMWTGATTLGDSAARYRATVGQGFDVYATGLTAPNQTLNFLSGEINSNCTSFGQGLIVRLNTQNATYTTPNVYVMAVQNGVKGSGHTVTNLYMLYIEAPSWGSSSNYTIWAGAGLYHFDGLTANQAVSTDGSKNLTSIPYTGTGNVVRSISPIFSGTANFANTVCTGFKLSTAPTNGHVLTSDATGNGTWQAAAGGGAEVDGQTVQASSQQTRGTDSWADLASMTLTTSSTASKKYLVIFSWESDSEFDADRVRLRILADGIEVSGTDFNKINYPSEVDACSIHGLTPSLATAKIIKVQWRSMDNPDEVYIYQRTLSIYGVS